MSHFRKILNGYFGECLKHSLFLCSNTLLSIGAYIVIREEALDWFEEAKVDYERALRSLRDKDYSLACYMCHQAIEKAFKAVMIGLKRKRPPHAHDLTFLYENIRDIIKLSSDIEEALPEISQYYVTARYPQRRVKKAFAKLQ